jgi:ferredoxin
VPVIGTAPGLRSPAAEPPADLAALARWLRHTPDVGDIELSCAEHEAAGVAVPRRVLAVRLSSCLHDVPGYAVLELLTAGARTVRLRLDGCAHGADAGRWPTVPERLVVIDRPPVGRTRRGVLDAGALPVARRALLGLPGSHPTSPAPAGSAQQRLIAEALTLTVDAERSTLSQLPQRCSGCGRCVTSCPVQAISAVGHHPWAVLREVRAVPLAQPSTCRCVECGAAVVADADADVLCPTCAFRRDSPFGSITPEQMLARLRASSPPPGERRSSEPAAP